MSREPKNNEEGFMYKLASFIVDKRNLIFLIVAIGLVFSVFSRNWVQVENQLSAYLPKDSETYRGLHLMEDEFITFGTAKVMLVNVTYDEAQAVSERLEAVDGVQSVTFDDTKEHYTNASALYNITFDYSETDEMCETVMNRVEDELSGYDIYVSATFGDTASKTLAQEIGVIVIIVTLVHVSGEVAFQQVGEVRTCRYYPALADAVVGKDGNGEIGVFHFGFDSTRPKTCQLSAVGIDDFHTVVLYGGFGSHVLVLQPQSQGKSPLFLFVEPLGGITFDGNGDARCVAVYLAYLLGQGNGRCTADIESGFNVVFPTVQIGVDKTFVSLFLCLYVGYHCQQYGYRANKMMLFHIL